MVQRSEWENQNMYHSRHGLSGYQWHKRGKRLAVLWRILSTLLMPVGWLSIGFYLIYMDYKLEAVKLWGLLGLLLSLFITIVSLLLFVNNLLVRIADGLSSQGRHDFNLYRYWYGFHKKEGLRVTSLLAMARLDILMDDSSRAEAALDEINTAKLSASQLKLFALLRIAAKVLAHNLTASPESGHANATGAELSKAPELSVADWYIRYSGISDASGSFPADAVVKAWMEGSSQGAAERKTQLIESISSAHIGPKAKLWLPLLMGLMLAHFVFFFTLQNSLSSDWYLRSNYAFIAGSAAGMCILALGTCALWLFEKGRRGTDRPRGKLQFLAMILRGIVWEILMLMFAGITVLSAFTFDEEKVLARDTCDPWTGRRYTYLAMESSYGGNGVTRYYRAPNFMIMEDIYTYPDWLTDANASSADTTEDVWETETAASDMEASEIQDSKTQTDVTEASGTEAFDTETSAGETSETGTSNLEEFDTGVSEESFIDDGFAAQNAMQRVYEYLQKNNVYPDLSISYDANAKGNLYARISSGAEIVDGGTIDYELRLYDNGVKDTSTEQDANPNQNQGDLNTAGKKQLEIVCEKVYLADGMDTRLMGFYLVDPISGEVTDEHKTTW
ncbi:hypothetical protein ACTNEN_09285 [Oribacterium sp. HCP28S3_H8]|uniref:hypothetical protein n=1 Tax=Oribacterium sp. HCP28S3_H8 TaxID=3438945 RepID=UPI003F8BD2AE